MDHQITYSVADALFARHPAYRVGVVLARNVRNGPSQPGMVDAFQDACASLSATVALETLSNDDRIRPWREAFRAFGARPSDFRPSVEALARRALRNSLSPLGRLIDMGTVTSLRHLVPVGGHALEEVRGDVALRLATGDEKFRAVGSMSVERPTPGEVILAEGDTVLTRRWVWRQSDHTSIKADTRHLFYNIDVLPDGDIDVMAIAADLSQLITEHAGGEVLIEVLDVTHPTIELAF